jgi:uncharacterized membrane protein
VTQIENEVIINRPIEEVFSFVSNIENYIQWQSGVIEAKLTSEGPLGLGSTYKYSAKLLGRKIENNGKYTEYIPNKKITFKGTSGPFPGQGTYSFENVNGGTKLSTLIEADIGGFFKIAEGLVVKQFKKQFDADFENLKTLLESQT